MRFQLGIIGAGVMANAILNQVLASNIIASDQITIFDIDKSKTKNLNINVSGNIQELIDNSEFILFAVKPQQYADICAKNTFRIEHTVISIMAGVKISTLKSQLKLDCPIVRVMPNTPCRVGKGMCALCFNGVETKNINFIRSIFGACGDTIEIEESMFDTVTSISGSGPAYIYLFLDGMIKGGMNGGLSYDDSKKLSIATMAGACELAKGSMDTMAELTDRVCSKGGTTIEAVNVFKSNHLTEIIQSGIDACRKKSIALSENL